MRFADGCSVRELIWIGLAGDDWFVLCEDVDALFSGIIYLRLGGYIPIRGKWTGKRGGETRKIDKRVGCFGIGVNESDPAVSLCLRVASLSLDSATTVSSLQDALFTSQSQQRALTWPEWLLLRTKSSLFSLRPSFRSLAMTPPRSRFKEETSSKCSTGSLPDGGMVSSMTTVDGSRAIMFVASWSQRQKRP